MQKSINLELLKKVTLGRRQSSGVMHVIPIIYNNLSNDLASFDDVSFNRTVMYGMMEFSNVSEKPFIIPAGYSIITKQNAQDHGIPHASFIEGNTKKVFQNACCIQQSQPGMIDGENLKENFIIMPISIRGGEFFKAPNNSHYLDFSRLWKHISAFQKGLVSEGVGNLVLFFNRYMDQLATFSAEFEPVHYQIGAIIMINDEIVGIEIAPTHEYFLKIWDGLIRGAYGAEALSRSLKSLIPTFEGKKAPNLNNAKDLDDIFNAVQVFRNENREKLIQSITEIFDADFEKFAESEYLEGKFKHQFFSSENKKTLGEMFVDDSGNPVYLSLFFPA